MPRASDGTVTLVAGNPVVADTDIVTTWANPTISDLASMAQDSLSRSGKGGMLVPFQNLDGTVSAPGITFTNQTGTGFYRSAAGVGFAIAGVLKALFATALATFKTAVKMDSTLEVTGRITATAGVAGLLLGDVPVNYKLSTLSTGNFLTSNLGWTDVTNAIVTGFVATGRPVQVYIVDDATGNEFQLGATNSAATLSGIYFQVLRGATAVSYTALLCPKMDGVANGSASFPPGTMFALDVPPAGTYAYKLQTKVAAATDRSFVENAKLFVKEV